MSGTERQNVLPTLVLGLGASGLAAIAHLRARGVPVQAADSRAEPPGLATARARWPEVAVRLGPLTGELLVGIGRVVLSPGLSVDAPVIADAAAAGIPVVGELELFAQAAQAPIAAITGTNGKSTVTTLLGEMARAAGLRVAVGGNLGPPALELLDPDVELYVLEVSSFQLEAAPSLRVTAGAVLNVTADHLDRHGELQHYAALKRRLIERADVAVLNADDPVVAAMAGALDPRIARLWFTAAAPGDAAHFGIRQQGAARLLCHGETPLLAAEALGVTGRHNEQNVLAAWGLAEALRGVVAIEPAARLAAAQRFTGLAHRLQPVGERQGLRFIDDSKGTNLGATAAALGGLDTPVVLIAGGQAKGQDPSELRDPLTRRVRAAVLIGQDAALLAAAWAGAAPVVFAADMASAVAAAAALARPGDTVLLSPACASLDMFSDYRARGAAFARAVRELPA